MKNSQDSKSSRSSNTSVPGEDSFSRTQIQSVLSGHKLTYISCFVIITFVVCVTQEFTFILNYPEFTRTTPVALATLVLLNNTSQRGFRQSSGKDDWRKVTNSIYVYSAFWENRYPNGSYVKIIGGADYNKPHQDRTKCLIKHRNSGEILETPATYKILIEDHGRLGKAIFIKCNVTHEQPDYVSLVPLMWNRTWASPEWMPVHDIGFEANVSRIGLCVRPMYGFIDAFRVAEFIAYHEALGVSQFTFYAYEMPASVFELLQELKRNKYDVEVLPWTLPPKLSTIWAYGQMASINDCVYRQMRTMSYTVIADIDEFLTPRKVVTLQEFLGSQDLPEGKYGSFVFRSTVFCSEYDRDVLPSYVPPFLTQSSIYRRNFIYPFQIRSKYVLKPAMVEVAGIHCVWQHLPPVTTKLIAAGEVLVHHYRSRLCYDKHRKIPKGVIDVKSRKYLNQLLRSRTIEIWREKFGKSTDND